MFLLIKSVHGTNSRFKKEPVYLAFDWQNVLQVPLAISNIFLECETDATKMDKSVWPLLGGYEPPEKLETCDFDVEVLSDMALDANERRRVSPLLYIVKQRLTVPCSSKSGFSPRRLFKSKSAVFVTFSVGLFQHLFPLSRM